MQLGTPTSVVVRWRTAQPTDSAVDFGTAPGWLTRSKTSATPTTEHELVLTGLQPATRYYYRIGASSKVLAGGDASHSFFSAPPPGTRQPIRIWAIGDAGKANAGQRAVRDAYLRYTAGRSTDVWLMLGDNAYERGSDQDYQAGVFAIYPELLRQTLLWPTFGNHDGWTANSSTQSGPYYDIFTLPTRGEAGGVPSGTEAYYSFDYGNVHFVCLDASESSRTPSGPMLTWLEQDLAANHAQWTIAFWHQPPYSKGSRNSDTERDMIEMRQNALPILESHSVDLVLTGHSHSYERSYLLHGHYGASSTFNASMIVDGGDGQEDGDGAYLKPTSGAPGTVYVVAGNAAEIHPGGALNHPAMLVASLALGSVVVDVNGGRLDATLIGTAEQALDHFTVLKSASAPTEFSASFQDGVAPAPSYTRTRDTYLAAAQPSTAFGEASVLQVDGDVPAGSAHESAALVAWNLDAIPVEATVESARIIVNVSNLSTSVYRMFELKRDWQEEAATWGAFAAGSPWSGPGASATSDRGSELLGEIRASALGTQTIELNPAGVQLIQDWIKGVKPNYGFILANEFAGNKLEFTSRASPTPAKRPRLEIRYRLAR